MKGGLDMIHLKISWIKRLVSNLEGSWQTLLLTNLNKYGHIRAISLHRQITGNCNLLEKSLLERCIYESVLFKEN